MISRVRDAARSVMRKLAEWDSGSEPFDRRDPAGRLKRERWTGAGVVADATGSAGWLHRFLPAAIVAVSLGAATMGWQASVADERATVKDDMSRQELFLQQQVGLRKVQEVDADVRLFSEVEQQQLIAIAAEEQLTRAANRERATLAEQAAAHQESADALAHQVRFQEGELGAVYNVKEAARLAVAGDPQLTSFEPNRLHEVAETLRNRGVDLVGIAVIYIAALVFFTCAAVTSGRGGARLAGTGSRLRGTPGEAPAYWFASAGALATLGASVLFVVVRWM
jgi:hypothetical protein